MASTRAYRTALTGVLGWALAAWIAGGSVFGAAAMAADMPKVKIATEGTYRPFSYVTADGKLTGFDVELALAVCKAAGLDCEMVTMDFDGMIPALNEKKVDAIDAGIVIAPKFKKVVALTDPIRASGKRFVSCTPNESPDVSPAGLKGRTIGTQGNTSSADCFDAYFKGEDIRLYKSMDEAYQDLTAGRVDLVLSQEGAAYGFISSPSGKGCSFVGPRVNDPKLFGSGVGIAVRKDDAQLTAALNAGIRKVLANGTYKALNAKYFPFSVY
jgi:lysine-arginine-ornithine-binding protein